MSLSIVHVVLFPLRNWLSNANCVYLCFLFLFQWILFIAGVIVFFDWKCFDGWLSFCITTLYCCWFFHLAKNHLFIYHSNHYYQIWLAFKRIKRMDYLYVVYAIYLPQKVPIIFPIRTPDKIRSIHCEFLPICINLNSLE